MWCMRRDEYLLRVMVVVATVGALRTTPSMQNKIICKLKKYHKNLVISGKALNKFTSFALKFSIEIKVHKKLYYFWSVKWMRAASCVHNSNALLHSE